MLQFKGSLTKNNLILTGLPSQMHWFAGERDRIFVDNAWDLISVLFAMPAQLFLYLCAMLVVVTSWVQVCLFYFVLYQR
jgi:hypothetical protein